MPRAPHPATATRNGAFPRLKRAVSAAALIVAVPASAAALADKKLRRVMSRVFLFMLLSTAPACHLGVISGKTANEVAIKAFRRHALNARLSAASAPKWAKMTV
jgi:hypothetical protein